MREFVYAVIRFLFNVVTYLFIGMKVYGEAHIPKTGAFIMASNHASYFDPPLVGTAVHHRLIHFMAKEELFHNPLMGWFLRYVKTFPVHRGRVDRKAMAEALRVLKEGEVLGIFPEGTSKFKVLWESSMKEWQLLPSSRAHLLCRRLLSIPAICRRRRDLSMSSLANPYSHR